MENFTLEIITPEGLLHKAEASLATLPGDLGYFGVLKDHAPFAAALKPGILNLEENGKSVARFYIEGGYAHINPESTTVMANYALNVAEIKKDALKQRLSELDEKDAEYTRINTLLDVLSKENIAA